MLNMCENLIHLLFTSDIPKQIDMIKESMDRYDFYKIDDKKIKEG